jgi:hypothetical protein
MLVDREGTGLLQDSLSRGHLIQGAVRDDDEMIGLERRLVTKAAARLTPPNRSSSVATRAARFLAMNTTKSSKSSVADEAHIRGLAQLSAEPIRKPARVDRMEAVHQVVKHLAF